MIVCTIRDLRFGESKKWKRKKKRGKWSLKNIYFRRTYLPHTHTTLRIRFCWFSLLIRWSIDKWRDNKKFELWAKSKCFKYLNITWLFVGRWPLLEWCKCANVFAMLNIRSALAEHFLHQPVRIHCMKSLILFWGWKKHFIVVCFVGCIFATFVQRYPSDIIYMII